MSSAKILRGLGGGGGLEGQSEQNHPLYPHPDTTCTLV